MKRCIVSYLPSSNEIHTIYNSIEEARKDVKFLNSFSNGGEKLCVGIAELTDEEYRKECGEDER